MKLLRNLYNSIYLTDLDDNANMSMLLASTNTLSSINSLVNTKLPLSFKNGEDIKHKPAELVKIMYTLLSKLLSDTSMIVSHKLKEGETKFTTKNETQFFTARTLSLIYVKASILDRFLKYLEDKIWMPEEKQLMIKLSSLYGLWCLEEHASSLLRYY